MKKPLYKAASILIAVILTASLCVPALALPLHTAAVKTAIENIAAGEKFLIVNDAGRNTVSKYSTGKRLAKATVSFNGNGLNGISEEAAVFTYEYNGDGDILLLCDQGYLTSSDTGNGLFYTDTPTKYSVWRVEEGCYLYNVNSAYMSNGKENYNNYLEYYPKSDFYSTYGKSGDTSLFKMSFYKLTDDAEQTEDGAYRLPVFETSDIHGYIAYTSDKNYEYRLAYTAGRVNAKRFDGQGHDTKRTLLLDGGDIYQGNPVSNLLEGQSVSAVFDIMKYDAVTVGNHEFDWTIEKTVDGDGTMPDYTYMGKRYENKIPVLVSNMYKDGEKVRFARDYLIFEKTAVNSRGETAAVKIAVIGFAMDYSSSIMYSKFTGAGYAVKVDYNEVNALAKRLEDEGLCDATVLLCHAEASEIANGLGGGSVIDLVLGGHTHQDLCGKSAGGIQYMQPGGSCTSYACAELLFELGEDGRPAFTKVAGAQTLSAPETAMLYKDGGYESGLDGEVLKVTDAYLSDIKPLLNAKIGYITVPSQKSVFIDGSGQRATTSGNWLSSITMRAVDADVGFINSGGIRADFTIPAGEDKRVITVADVYTMLPFDNKIYCFELTYPEFLTLLQYSLTRSGRTLLSYMYGVDCYFTGLTVNAIVKDGAPIYVDGKWQNGAENGKIKVAVSEFIATSDRVSDGMSNPLCSWVNTDRLISSHTTDNEGALDVLKGEAEKSGGPLYIDTKPHCISGKYAGVDIPLSPSDDTNVPDIDREIGETEEPQKNETLSRFLPLIIEVSVIVVIVVIAVIIGLIIKRRREK